MMQRNRPYERRAHVATRFCEAYSTSRCTSESTPRFCDVGDCDDVDECAYMNVEQDSLLVPSETPAPTTLSVAITDGSYSSCTPPLVEVESPEGYLIPAPPQWPSQACPKGTAKAKPPNREAPKQEDVGATSYDPSVSTVHESRNARMDRRESSCERSRIAWIRRNMMGSSSSSQEREYIHFSADDAELIAAEAELEEALTDGIRMCQRIGEEEAEVRAEKIRKEQEEDDARYFHMLREQSSGRLKLFVPAIDYRWFQYCFQGHELPNGQSAQQILDMAAVHDEINNYGIYEYDPDGEDDSNDEDYDGVPRRVAQWLRGRPIYNLQYARRNYHPIILEDDDQQEPHAYMLHRDHYAVN